MEQVFNTFQGAKITKKIMTRGEWIGSIGDQLFFLILIIYVCQ